MKSKKIQLPNGAEEFIIDCLKEGLSLRESIWKWNREQEIKKYLGEGVVVKVRSVSYDPWNGKKGFICKIVHPIISRLVPDSSGRYSECFFNENENHRQGDFNGSELEPTGEIVSKEEVLNFMNNTPEHSELHKELESTLQIF